EVRHSLSHLVAPFSFNQRQEGRSTSTQPPHHRIQSSAPLTTAKKAEARPRSIVAYCSSLFSARRSGHPLLCSSLRSPSSLVWSLL
ncbi:hypothetical protein S245_059377, partial [Arachis hypogaea]